MTNCQQLGHAEEVTVLAVSGWGVDTLRCVTTPEPEPHVFDVYRLAARWGISRQRVHEIRKADARFPEPSRLGQRRGEGTFAWSLAQVLDYERVSGRSPVARPPEPPRE